MNHDTSPTLIAALRKAMHEDDLDAACLLIQEALGVTDGGVAAMFFSELDQESLNSGPKWADLSAADRHAKLIGYVRVELDYMALPAQSSSEETSEPSPRASDRAGMADAREQDSLVAERDEAVEADFAAFQATRTEMTGMAFGKQIGDRMWEDQPEASLLVYEGRWYIDICQDGRHMLTLENRGWITGHGVTLEDLERELFTFARL